MFMYRMYRFIVAGLLIGAAAYAPVAKADEGMWLLTSPPSARLKSEHGFEVTPQWLEHLQKSAVRFNTGGSGSLVSSTGLVLTNHHVISDMLSKLSTPERDLLKTGFLAKTQGEEIACPDLELNVLWSIEDVTARVTTAAKDAGEAGAPAARRRAIAEIEAESKNATGLTSEVVTLYQGARYHLYRYKKYTDVRFVFAPEQTAAFFGGDTDNFEFPRYNLDCALLRIYEKAKPISPEHHLTWSSQGVNDSDLVFVCGHPGRTRRGLTLDHFKFLRDFETPRRLARYWRTEIALNSFAGRSAEHARLAADDLHGYSNSRKATTGLMSGLADPALLIAKERAEQNLIAATRASGSAEREAKLSTAIAKLSSSLATYRTFAPRYELLNLGPNRAGEYMTRAVHIARLADELPKPSADRLREYGDAKLESLKEDLFSPAPIYDTLETFRIEQFLLTLVEQLGGDDALVQTLLAGKNPAKRAEELVSGCTFKSIDARKALVDGGSSAISASRDPMLEFVRLFDAEARALRTRFENEVEAVERECYAVIAGERFAAMGESVYPDATFTLRLSYGTVKGVRDQAQAATPFTDIGGMFNRFAERKGEPGFEIPQSWFDAKSRINLATPFNFTTTCDIIGGNSGSPVVNSRGDLVGLVFDGNIHSLVGDVQYDVAFNRSIAVDARAIIEALRNIYSAPAIADELTK